LCWLWLWLWFYFSIWFWISTFSGDWICLRVIRRRFYLFLKIGIIVLILRGVLIKRFVLVIVIRWRNNRDFNAQ
jgi:hypothetical protein